LPFEQNVRQTKEAVETLKTINSAILVEGEIHRRCLRDS